MNLTLFIPTDIIENIIVDSINTFPNLGSGSFAVTVSDKILQNAKLTVSNLLGVVFHERELNFGRNQININQTPGIYFLTVSSKSKKYSTKLIVQQINSSARSLQGSITNAKPCSGEHLSVRNRNIIPACWMKI